jgi:hypothetical protein
VKRRLDVVRVPAARTIAERELGSIPVHLASIPGDVGMAYLMLVRLRHAIDALGELAAYETVEEEALRDHRYAECTRLLNRAMRQLERT